MYIGCCVQNLWICVSVVSLLHVFASTHFVLSSSHSARAAGKSVPKLCPAAIFIVVAWEQNCT